MEARRISLHEAGLCDGSTGNLNFPAIVAFGIEVGGFNGGGVFTGLDSAEIHAEGVVGVVVVGEYHCGSGSVTGHLERNFVTAFHFGSLNVVSILTHGLGLRNILGSELHEAGATEQVEVDPAFVDHLGEHVARHLNFTGSGNRGCFNSFEGFGKVNGGFGGLVNTVGEVDELDAIGSGYYGIACTGIFEHTCAAIGSCEGFRAYNTI